MNEMLRKILYFVMPLFCLCFIANAEKRDYVIVVHGGAGALSSLKDQPEKKIEYYAALDSALMVGDRVLSTGGTGIDAVVAVVEYLENNPLFNAGVGSTCTADATFELDASIMDGKDLGAGAIAGVKHKKTR